MEQIGKFDRTLILQSASGSTNLANEDSETWANIGTAPEMWCQVIETRGKESLRADQIDVIQPTLFRIRYRADLNEKMRLIYNTHPYYIEGIKEIGRREYLELFTRVSKEEVIT